MNRENRARVMTRRDLQRKEREQEVLCDQWNDRYHYPPGQNVELTKDDGAKVQTRTRSIAWMVGGTAVVLVEGITGGYALERIKPLP